MRNYAKIFELCGIMQFWVFYAGSHDRIISEGLFNCIIFIKEQYLSKIIILPLCTAAHCKTVESLPLNALHCLVFG